MGNVSLSLSFYLPFTSLSGNELNWHGSGCSRSALLAVSRPWLPGDGKQAGARLARPLSAGAVFARRTTHTQRCKHTHTHTHTLYQHIRLCKHTHGTRLSNCHATSPLANMYCDCLDCPVSVLCHRCSNTCLLSPTSTHTHAVFLLITDQTHTYTNTHQHTHTHTHIS